jgi:hypothetical protein
MDERGCRRKTEVRKGREGREGRMRQEAKMLKSEDFKRIASVEGGVTIDRVTDDRAKTIE